MNLLVDPVLTLSDGTKVSLPGLLAAMAQGKVRGFAALRPHQRPAWHMFLVQLTALSLCASKSKEPAESPDEWARALRKLTPQYEDDAPWHLVVSDTSKPAFMQPPLPEKLNVTPVSTPDDLDMLITARNHELKQSIARDAAPEDWIYALVSLQTCEGYGGRGNNGIARMNGGSSSRPLLGLAPAKGRGDFSVDHSAWWARDVRYLLNMRSEERSYPLGTSAHHSLLWCLDWPEGEQLDLHGLDPWFIEVCRRVRLSDHAGRLSALRATSKAPRVDAKAFKGNTGDPWAPVHKDGRSLTLGTGDFDYSRLCSLMFSGDWSKPMLAHPRSDEREDMLLVAEAFARGNSKTEGFKSRIVPVPGAVVSRFTTKPLGTLAAAQMDEIRKFNGILGYAIALLAAGGEPENVKKDHYGRASLARKRFDTVVDELFFPSLWHRFAASTQEEKEDAKTAFLRNLLRAANSEFMAAMPSVPCAHIRRPRAEARARRAFRNRVWKEFPGLIETESRNETE